MFKSYLGGLLLAILAVGSGACSGAAEGDEAAADGETLGSITQPIFGGNTVVDNTSTTGLVGATAAIIKNANNHITCSGTLVTPTKIVTAAHCVRCPDITDPSTLSVGFAQTRTGADSGAWVGPTFPLARAPVFSPASDSDCIDVNPAFDVAVLTLATPVPPAIATPQPVLLADTFSAINDNTLFQPCSLAGYGGGVDTSGQGAGPRRVGSAMPALHRSTDFINQDLWHEPRNSNQAHTADGDSGGGLFCTLNGAPALVGVIAGYMDNDAIQGPTGNPLSRSFLIEQLEFPLVAPTSAFAALAKGFLNVNDRASVVDSSGNHGAMIGSGTGGRLGTDTFVGNTFSQGSMAVADRVRVEGTVTANANISVGNQVQGTFLRYRYSRLPTWNLPVTFPTAPAPSVLLGPGVQRTIGSEFAGKRIPRVTVDQNANLRLACGTTYYVTDLVINAGGRISVDTSCGPGRIFVSTHFTNNNGEIVDLNPGFGDILLGYTGPYAVHVGAFQGTIVAPGALVSVANGVSFMGAIFALGIEIHQDSALIHYPFNFPWLPG